MPSHLPNCRHSFRLVREPDIFWPRHGSETAQVSPLYPIVEIALVWYVSQTSRELSNLGGRWRLARTAAGFCFQLSTKEQKLWIAMHGRWLRLYVSHTWRIMHCNPKQIPGGDSESYTVPEVRQNKSCTSPNDFFIQKNIHKHPLVGCV